MASFHPDMGLCWPSSTRAYVATFSPAASETLYGRGSEPHRPVNWTVSLIRGVVYRRRASIVRFLLGNGNWNTTMYMAGTVLMQSTSLRTCGSAGDHLFL